MFMWSFGPLLNLSAHDNVQTHLWLHAFLRLLPPSLAAVFFRFGVWIPCFFHLPGRADVCDDAV